MIVNVEPGNDGVTPVFVRVTREEATRLARLSFAQARPDRRDPRSDSDALDDYMMVHWAWEEDAAY